jgi:hypothetical protein
MLTAKQHSLNETDIPAKVIVYSFSLETGRKTVINHYFGRDVLGKQNLLTRR